MNLREPARDRAGAQAAAGVARRVRPALARRPRPHRPAARTAPRAALASSSRRTTGCASPPMSSARARSCSPRPKAQQLEGVVAKRIGLAVRCPGRRTDAWRKIKLRHDPGLRDPRASRRARAAAARRSARCWSAPTTTASCAGSARSAAASPTPCSTTCSSVSRASTTPEPAVEELRGVKGAVFVEPTAGLRGRVPRDDEGHAARCGRPSSSGCATTSCPRTACWNARFLGRLVASCGVASSSGPTGRRPPRAPARRSRPSRGRSRPSSSRSPARPRPDGAEGILLGCARGSRGGGHALVQGLGRGRGRPRGRCARGRRRRPRRRHDRDRARRRTAAVRARPVAREALLRAICCSCRRALATRTRRTAAS